MGNFCCSGGGRRRQGSRRSHPPTPPNQPPQPEIKANSVFAAVTLYPAPYPNPSAGYHQYHPPAAGYCPPPPPAMRMPLPAPYDHHHPVNWAPGRYPCLPPLPVPFVEYQKAVTIRNDVNLKKETLRVEPDEDNPGKFLVAFTFDATAAGSITVIYFANEGKHCKLTATKEKLLLPVTVHFEQGLGQKFRQPSGTGIDFSMFEESDLVKEGEMDIYPLAVKADICPANEAEAGSDGNPFPGSTNSQITQAIFDKGEYKVKVLKQILWVNGIRYELQEIYGIGNSVECEFDSNDPGKECVICLSEPRDTVVLPCRHMCMCSGCAKVWRFHMNRCPICCEPAERLLEIKVSNGNEEEKTT